MNILEEYSTKENLVINDLTNEALDLDLQEEAATDIPIDDGNRKLYIDKVDKSTSDLFRMIRENEINLQPSFQRSFVWNDRIMSKFIESLLLAIPIPTIFFSENQDSTYDVIDGQQRLTTIFSFMKDQLSGDEEEGLSNYLKGLEKLKLKGLDTLSGFNNMTFKDLNKEVRRKFNNVSLPVVIVQKDSTEDIKFDIFSRINQGSVKLNQQELRNVMYRGPLMERINDLANQMNIKKVFGNRPVLEKRFGFQEIILRAVVMERFVNFEDWDLKVNQDGEKYGGRLNSVIVSYLKKYQNDVKEADRVEELVNKMFHNVYTVFEEKSFMRYTHSEETKYVTSLNKTVSEVELVVLSNFSEDIIEKNKDLIFDSFRNYSMGNEDIFTKATNNTANVIKRYEWGAMVSKELPEK